MLRLLRITIAESSDQKCNWRYGVQRFFRRIGFRRVRFRRIGKTPWWLTGHLYGPMFKPRTEGGYWAWIVWVLALARANKRR